MNKKLLISLAVYNWIFSLALLPFLLFGIRAGGGRRMASGPVMVSREDFASNLTSAPQGVKLMVILFCTLMSTLLNGTIIYALTHP